MIGAAELSNEVGAASALLGLLLVLVTLFTSEQARRQEAALDADKYTDTLRHELFAVAVALELFTVGAIAGLFQLAGRAIATAGRARIDPVLWIFVLAWFLLGGLVIWLASILGKCSRTKDERQARTRQSVEVATVLVALGDVAVLVWGLGWRPG